MLRRSFAMFLCLVMVLSIMPVQAFAREDCEHHLEHDAACGYQEAVEGVPCGHVCGEGCPTKEVTACVHDHAVSGCTYTEPKEAVCCGHTCGDGSCGYRAAVSGSDCTCGAQPHAEGCGYVEAQPEIPCDFIHNGCGCAEAVAGGWSCGHVCTGDSGCVKAVCAHTCPGDDCGFVASRNPSPCTYSCGVCQIQELIDALPEEVTLENMEAVGAQLTAIDEARAKLSDEELELVDFTRYHNAIAAINVLNGMPGAEEPETIATWEYYTNWYDGVECAIIDQYNGSGGSVTVPGYIDGYKVIGIFQRTFYDKAEKITSLKLPNTIQWISPLEDCENLVSVDFSAATIKEIPDSMFYCCYKLSSIKWPKGLTTIGESAFAYCKKLTSVTIPSTVTTIEGDKQYGAFAGCTSLTSFNMANTKMTSVSPYLLQGCTALKTVSLPSTVTSIGTSAFEGCTSLTSFTFPANVTRIGEAAFRDCTGITAMTLPSKLQSIGDYAFTGTGITTLALPDSINNVTGTSFQWMNSLSTITVGSGNSFYKVVDGVLFNKSGTKLVCYPANKRDISTYQVPKGVTTIGKDGFGVRYNNNNVYGYGPLSKIYFPDTVTRFEYYGMGYYSGSFYFCGNMPSYDSWGIGYTGNCRYYYTRGTTGWGSVANRNFTYWPDAEHATVKGGQQGADCENAGGYLYSCATCGYTYCDGTLESALGHTYGRWVSNNNGTHSRTCGRDGSHVETKNCSGGTATCTGAPVCADCGYIYGTKLQHNWKYRVDDSSATVYASCDGCGTDGGFVKLSQEARLIYDGTAKPATLTLNDWQAAGVDSTDIVYTLPDGTTTFRAPSEVGIYTVSVAIGIYADISITYEIVKADYVAKATVNGVTTSYESLEDAFTAANNAASAEVVLLKDITGALTGDVDIQVTGNVTLDLGGFDITDKLIWVKSGGSLTVRDSGSQPGKVSQTGDYSSYLTNAGTLKLESGSITCGVDNTGTMTVSGGSVSGPGSAAIQNNGTLYVKGGSVNGLANGIINMGTLEVSGGTVTGATAITTPIPGVTAVTGGSISGKNLDIDYGGTATGILQGGTFADGLSLRGISLQKALGQGKGYFVDGIYVKVTDTAATTLSGKVEVKAADESNYRIFIDREGYAQGFAALDDAFAAVQPGDTLRLTQDAVGEAELTKSGSFTLDLGGKAVAGDVTVGSGAELTVTGNGYLDATVLVKGSLKVPAGTDYSRVFGEAGAKLTVGTLEMTWDASVNRWVCGSHRWAFGEGIAKCSVCGLEEVLTITAQDATFSGEPLQPVVTVTLGSARLTEGTDFTLSYGNNINAGIGSVTVTGIGNCSGTAETAFTIQPLAIQVDIASIPDRPYSGEAVTPNVELVLEEGYSGPIPQLGSDYTLTYTDNMGPGTASVTVRACEGGNFTFRSVTQTYGIRHGVELPGVTGTVYVDGVPSQVEDGILWLDESGAKLITLYDHANAGAEDLHTVYPTAMYVYEVTGSAEQGYTARRVTELDNILQYSGTSIRITGNQGIRFITSIPNAKKSALTGSGLAGFTLVEYGTLMGWYDEGKELLYDVNVKSVAYSKASGTDAVFNRTGDLCQFTGMLTDLELEQSTRDLMTRPYMVLARTGADGQTEQVVLYGGSIVRSIGYVAYQNKDVFKPGTSSYEFIWKILSYAYPDLYEAEYKG